MARREPGAAASAGLEARDPDHVAAVLAELSRKPLIAVVLFQDYATRDLLLETIEAELLYTWGLATRRLDLRDLLAMDSLLETASSDKLTMALNLEDAIEKMPRLNVSRDALANNRTVIWLSADRYPDISREAPDLMSYSTVLEPALVGALSPQSVLEPNLRALENKWGMVTSEFLQRLKNNTLPTMPEEVIHNWLALAKLLGHN